MRTTRIVMLGAFVVVPVAFGCGGGNQKAKAPMVADSPALTDTTPEEDAKNWGSGEDAGAPAAAGEKSADPALQGNEEGAHALLKQFVAPNADHAALTKNLRPTSFDYKALFDTSTAVKVEVMQAKDWESNKAVIKPKPTQTEVKVWSATGGDLAAGKGNASLFPAGYKKVAKHLIPTMTFYRFKFVEPGKDQGTAYDGLAFVNGRWVIAPKPWKALESGKGNDRDDAEEGGDTPAPTPKKKPKGKKKKG